MKIGTDGVLLGAWASIDHNPASILDIGTGTGIISLMLAQRSSAKLIDAIEIDGDAYEQCVDNFEHSPWSDRLFCYHTSLNKFVDEIEVKYDLIVCNPPFYSEDYRTKNNPRNLARFQDALPFDHLIACVSKLLLDNGNFSVIIPFKEEDQFIATAFKYGLYPITIMHVKGTPSSQIKRSLLRFSFRKGNARRTQLIIEAKRHQYTQKYKDLTQDFYLNM
ncbi:tRNA1(Val) (adenine(37)-N6)-methyltransferase [Aestuariivivens sediminis]|uniref:tRNA1(Val) (adenine(37)-N6)-methyltransferase n=1 Tax=Aestuariivivens sediminis TaxID=2913557 RepID=UPI001F5AA668|nr:methyltransferase [Aestuariivivens sediminis]